MSKGREPRIYMTERSHTFLSEIFVTVVFSPAGMGGRIVNAEEIAVPQTFDSEQCPGERKESPCLSIGQMSKPYLNTAALHLWNVLKDMGSCNFMKSPQ